MGNDIVRLHHVGHIVRDMAQAITLYERLGFRLPPPSCPAIRRHEGSEPEPFGTGNSHADFPHSFLELVSWIEDSSTHRLPANARIVPLDAPPEVLPGLVQRIEETSANVAARLERFQGLHILMLSSPDIRAAATRLSDAGVRHGGVTTVRRPSDASDDVATVRYLEIGDDASASRPGAVAEGRVGVAAELDPDAQRAAGLLDHPNGAVDVVDAVLCVADEEVGATERRYATYLGREAHQDGPGRVFALDESTLTLVPASRLAELLPGEQPPALPAIAACTIAVRDLDQAAALLRRNGLPTRKTPSGDLLVPAEAALGAALVFRQAGSGATTRAQRPGR
ncbi:MULTISPECIES: VOC family protein [unclassified Streptomyces]|uniref:VOC family protein n=1 Tax=unclassified Streptomyces TaxID=2593676 RepID=UPI001661A5A9|nr:MULTISPECIES: VOC family protein [unclassified Streptomyces]MBD0839936.1 VOC family protein [Streptomyces sp. TRM68416]